MSDQPQTEGAADAGYDDLSGALRRRGALVLDGAMATELERYGADLGGALWSARVLLERPELVSQVHLDYLAAGADVITTASYQASAAGFAAHGLTRAEGERVMTASVELARAARDAWASDAGAGDRRAVVATSVGPYGAVLADGSEYRGDYAIGAADLVRFHRERLAVLVGAGVEVFAVETLPSLVEAQAVVEALADWPDVRAWVSFSARDGRQVSDGTPLAECARFLDAQDQVVAVGVNCVPVGDVSSLVREVASATAKPVIAYPNSGEIWDPVARTWRGKRQGHGPAADFGALARRWHDLGARIVGGCCRTGPADIRSVAAALAGQPT